MKPDSTMDVTEHPSARDVGERDLKASGWLNAATSELLPGVSVTPGMNVLDVGCGYGAYIEFCAKMGANITFIDRDESKVKGLDSRLKNLSGAVPKGIVSDCDPVPLPDGYADLVICTEVLEHVRDPDELTRELVRLGRSDATYVLTVPDARGEHLIRDVAHPDYFKEPNHIRIFTREDFEQLVKRCGLEVVRHDFRGSFWAIFYLFKWVTSEPGEPLFEDVHPITKLWTRTWAGVLQHPDCDKMLSAMNLALPKSQIIVARKCADADVSQD
jgi:ubiquinone/menaquinone biosynthesis C-methylase UbiE